MQQNEANWHACVDKMQEACKHAANASYPPDQPYLKKSLNTMRKLSKPVDQPVHQAASQAGSPRPVLLTDAYMVCVKRDPKEDKYHYTRNTAQDQSVHICTDSDLPRFFGACL